MPYGAAMTFAAAPRAHRDPQFLAAKLGRLEEPHLAPLSAFTRQVRRETGREVPWFDPDSGGTQARALFLFEAPGARSTGPDGPRARAAGSRIISSDNNDGTAQNMWLLQQQANLDRSTFLAWNIVPWYVGSGTRIREVDDNDLDEAATYLDRLLVLLPQLRLVVTFGDKPRKGWFRYLLNPEARLLPTLAVPHPSPQSINVNKANKDLILAGLRRAAQITGGPTAR